MTNRGATSKKAAAKLAALFPVIPPWTSAALWHGFTELAVPSSAILADEVDAIIEQRLAPLALKYLRENDVKTDPALLRRLRDSAFWWSSISNAVSISGAKVITMLNDRGYPIAVSKGPGIAAVYPSAGDRPYSDLDLLVRVADFRPIVDLLVADGWREDAKNKQPWSYFDRQCREALNINRFGGESVDIHHHIPPWIWGEGLSVEQMIARAGHVVAGRDVGLPCVTVEDNLLIAALHAASDKNKPGKTLIIWRDLAQLATVVDQRRAVELAEQAGLAGWLRNVLRALPEHARPQSLIDALPDLPVPHPLRINLLLAARPGEPSLATSQLARLPALRGLAFAAGMALPSPSFLREKLGDERGRYRRWWFGRRLHEHL